jgi:hypothetical protein
VGASGGVPFRALDSLVTRQRMEQLKGLLKPSIGDSVNCRRQQFSFRIWSMVLFCAFRKKKETDIWHDDGSPDAVVPPQRFLSTIGSLSHRPFSEIRFDNPSPPKKCRPHSPVLYKLPSKPTSSPTHPHLRPTPPPHSSIPTCVTLKRVCPSYPPSPSRPTTPL